MREQSIELVPDAGKVYTLWNTRFYDVLGLNQHDETFLVMRTLRWRF